MTVIAALWDRDGRPLKDECSVMLAAQRKGGPDSFIIGDKGLALGGAGGRGERASTAAPVDGAGGALTLVADARLDNREDLMSQLRLPKQSWGNCSDARLMMLCFEKWGAEVIAAFVGDFALILWDRAREALVLARDFAGQRPLFFWEGSSTIAAASLAKGLHALDFVPRRVDELRLLETLAGLPHEGRTTIFRQVERVLQGEVITFRRGHRTGYIFWTPPAGQLKLSSHTDYAEALNEKLDAAVTARLRDAGDSVGAHLSGGLDSSSVVASAALLDHARILAFTSVPTGSVPAVPANWFGDEGKLAAETAAMYPNVEHHSVEAGTKLPIKDLGSELELFERTDLNLPNLVWSNKINDAARAAGLRVMLTGTAGNGTISYGNPEILEHLLMEGHLRTFLAECVAGHRAGIGVRQLLTAPVKRFLPRPILRTLSRNRNWDQHPAFSGAVNPTAPGLANIIARFEKRETQFFANAVDVRLYMIRRVDPGTYNKGVLSRWDLDLRDPTADRRVVEFCLQVPLQHYFHKGTPRALIREALKGRVPESVRANRKRGLQSANWFSLLSGARQEMKQLLGRISEFETARVLLDIEKMQCMLECWPTPTEAFGSSEYRYGLLRGLSAGEFIRNNANDIDGSAT